jgi:hypothetical protein
LLVEGRSPGKLPARLIFACYAGTCLTKENTNEYRAFCHNALDRILSPDFTFIEPDGSVLDRTSYLADRGNNPGQTDFFEGTDMKVFLFGEVAMVTGLSKVTERRQGKTYEFQLRWKELWLKGPTGWKVRAGQATSVNPAWDKPFIVKAK